MDKEWMYAEEGKKGITLQALDWTPQDDKRSDHVKNNEKRLIDGDVGHAGDEKAFMLDQMAFMQDQMAFMLDQMAFMQDQMAFMQDHMRWRCFDVALMFLGGLKEDVSKEPAWIG